MNPQLTDLELRRLRQDAIAGRVDQVNRRVARLRATGPPSLRNKLTELTRPGQRGKLTDILRVFEL